MYAHVTIINHLLPTYLLTILFIFIGCTKNPCVHGLCVAEGSTGFKCVCDSEYSGVTCQIKKSMYPIRCFFRSFAVKTKFEHE